MTCREEKELEWERVAIEFINGMHRIIPERHMNSLDGGAALLDVLLTSR